jgi:hypothetical protein
MNRLRLLSHRSKREWSDIGVFEDCDNPIDEKTEKTEKTAAAAVQKRTSSPVEAVAQLRETWRIAELERKLSDLIQLVSSISGELKVIKCAALQTVAAPRDDSDPAIADVLSITHELFPGKVSLELTCDPSDTSVQIVIFNVRGTGAFENLIKKEIEWGNRVSQLPSRSSGILRLNVVPTT